jgi:hypothetical protein
VTVYLEKACSLYISEHLIAWSEKFTESMFQCGIKTFVTEVILPFCLHSYTELISCLGHASNSGIILL